MGRNRINLVLWTTAAAIACCISCKNNLADIVQNDVDTYKASISQTPPSIDSFTITSGAITYTGTVTFTLASQTTGTGAESITDWQVNENATAPTESDSGWVSFTSPVDGSYPLSNPGTYGTRTIYAWLKNDKGLVSVPATQNVQYARFGGPVVDSFTCTSGATSYDGTVSFSLGSTHPGEGATSITHYLVNESSTAPLPGDTGWQAFNSPQNGWYPLNSPGYFGSRIVYAWLKNDKDVVSASANFSVSYSDFGNPSFVVIPSSSPTDNPAITLNIPDAQISYGGGCTSIAGWLVREISGTPLPSEITGSKPTGFTLSLTAGIHTVYVWAKNEHDKVGGQNFQITINDPPSHWSDSYYVANCDVTAHEELTLLSDSIDLQSTAAATGTIGPGKATPGGTGNRTILVEPGTDGAGLWSTGARTLTVTATTIYGIPLTKSIALNVFRGVCVSTASDGGNDGYLGTATNPKANISAGITSADSLYLTLAGDTAEVRVSGGTYAVNWYAGQNQIVMAEGIVLKGGYDPNAWGSRSITGHLTTIEDGSSAGGTAVNPNRAVSFPDLTPDITSITVLDGFTIRPGTGSYNAGVYALKAAPIISNLTIIGRSGSSTSALYGLLLNGGSPQITSDTVFSTWEGTYFPSYSYGIYTMTETGKHPTIQGCTLSGGKGTSTYGIMSGGQADVIQNNTLVSGGYASSTGTSAGIRCEGGTALISGNYIDAGSNVNAAHAYGVQLSYSGAATNPSISGNTITCSGGATYDTFAIYETSTVVSDCDPSAVSTNSFSTFFGSAPSGPLGYYWDDGANKITNMTTTITLQSTSGTLTFFGNTTF